MTLAKYGVIGNPIAHSLSPLIHHHFAQQTNQSLSYERLLIGELGQGDEVSIAHLTTAIEALEKKGYQGLNVTHPFKEHVWQIVNAQGILTERARLAGAVNTLTLNQGLWIGDNTDGAGFMTSLKQQGYSDLDNYSILILGAGGAVRGIIIPLLNTNPAQLTLVNRTKKRAMQLHHQLQPLFLKTDILVKELAELQSSFDIIINGTSAGLHQHKFSLPSSILHPKTLCYDLSYAQTLTPFLSWARDQGIIQLMDGKAMLLAQAAEAFTIWRGVRPADLQSIPLEKHQP